MKKILVEEHQRMSMAKRARTGKAEAKAGRSDRDLELVTTLRFDCEETGKSFDYGVPGDAATLKDLWSRELMLSCPHCRQVHRLAFRPAYIRTILDGPGSLFDRIYRTGSANA